MTNQIHETAIIGDGVKLGKNLKIGAYTVIEGQIEIGDNTEIHSQVNISGNTKIGENNKIFPFASVGSIPQDLKYRGEDSSLTIGDNNSIREHVTINTGTEDGGNKTTIGSNCLFMIGSHIAHDCIVGNNVILANNATLAGHVEVGDFAIVGGLSAIHQFVRIGKHAMIGGMSGIESDVIPYGTAYGERANLQGLNVVGLKRRNYTRSQLQDIRKAYEEIFESDDESSYSDRIGAVKNKFSSNPDVSEIIKFIEEAKSRAICQPKKKAG